MTDPNPFQADTKSEDLTRNVTAFLDLEQAPLGTYYFNKENNYNYTQNWFNYSKFQIIPEHSIISEMVQYARPSLSPLALDPSKDYALAGTNLNASWAARVQTGLSTSLDSPGFSGMDAAQSVYLLTNYSTNAGCTIFNEDNTIAVTKAGNGLTSGCYCLSKYFDNGTVSWVARIRTQTANQIVLSYACVTDLQGNTYILGIGDGVVVFEDLLGNPSITLDVTNRTYLVAYNSSGIPLWITYFSGQHRGTLAVDNQVIGNVIVMFENESGLAVNFYDSVLISPTTVLTIPANANVIIAKFATSNGLFGWAGYVSGFRVGIYKNFSGFTNQSLACDTNGNIVCTGFYTQLDTATNGATPVQPTFTSTALNLPPYSSPVVWVPRESNREWSALDVEGSGQYMIAAVDNGFLYVSSNYGEDWIVRATAQRWSSVFCGTLGTLMVATIQDSIIFRSIDAGQTWIPSTLEGSSSRKWNALAGNASGSVLIASAENDYLFRSFDFGESWYISQNLIADGVVALAAGENALRTAFIDNNNQFLFFGTNTSPAKVIKVDGSTLPNPTWVSTLTLPAGEDNITTLAYDSIQGMGFYGTDTTPGKIIQVDLVPARVNGVTLTNIVANSYFSGLLDPTGTYAYLGSGSLSAPFSGRSQIIRINFTNPSGAPVVDQVLMTNVGDQALRSALISPSGQYGYFGNDFRQVITVDLNAWTRVGSTSLLISDGSDLRCAVMDSSGQYGYFGTSSPPNVVRVDLSTLPNPTRVGTAALPTGEEPQCGAIEPSGNYAYFGTYTIPAKIVKVDLTTFPNPARVGAITLASGQNYCNMLVMDPLGTFAYAGLYTSPGQIVKINIGTFTVVGTTVLTGYNAIVSGVMDAAGQYLYVMTTGETVKIDLSTMTIVGSLTPGSNSDVARVALINATTNRAYFLRNIQQRFYPINLTSYTYLPHMDLLNYRENRLQAAVKDPSSAFAYFGTYETYPGSTAGARIVKMMVNPTLTYYGSFVLSDPSVVQLSCAIVDSVGEYAYFGTSTAPGKVVKLDIRTLPYPTEIGVLTFDFGENLLTSAVIDPLNQFAYFGTNTTPGSIVKVNLSTFTRVESITLNLGDNALTSALMDPMGIFAYFGTNTSPGRVVVIELNTFRWVNTIVLAPGESLLTTAAINSTGDQLFFGTNQSPGKVKRLLKSITSPVGDWIDVAYDATLNAYVALIPNQLAYCSFDEGLTWSSIPTTPLVNWSAIAGSRVNAPHPYAFYATVTNGSVYGLNYNGLSWVWTVLSATPREYTAIATSGGSKSLTFATAYDGSIYQSIGQNNNVWIPTTIPRNWDAVAITSSVTGPLYAVAAVRGGQLYVTSDPYPYLHTFILKYSPSGSLQWANYVNCETGAEGDNVGVAVVCKPNQEIVVSGIFEENIDFFSAFDYSTVVKSLPVRTPDSTFLARNPRVTNNYLACYSADGIPLWVNAAVLSLDNWLDNQALFTALSVDNQNHLYVTGYSRSALLYGPWGGNTYASMDTGTAILVQYYPNGYVQSFTRLANQVAPNNSTDNYAFGTKVHVSPDGASVYVTGLNNSEDSDLDVFNSYGTSLAFTEPYTDTGPFIVRYATSASPTAPLPSPVYNNPFQPKLNIGGGNRIFIGGYVADTDIETWSSKTGLDPTPITLDDANAAVISYLGHEPGYTVPLDNGYPTTTDANMRHLAVQITEPTFPQNDPQPVTPGSIPYGYLPINLIFPSYTTAVTFNVNLNNATPVICSAIGTVPSSGLLISGVSAGDTVRMLINTPTTSRYVTLHVDALLPSDVATQTPSRIVFTEPTRYLRVALGGTASTVASATLIVQGTNRYVPAYYLPPVIEHGTLNLILQLYPQIHR